MIIFSFPPLPSAEKGRKKMIPKVSDPPPSILDPPPSILDPPPSILDPPYPPLIELRKRSTVEGDGTKTKTATTAVKGSKKKTKRATVEEDEKKKDANWTADGKKNAEEFMKRYSDMGIDGIKAEYRREIEQYKSPSYGDKAFRANTAKNRHSDPPTCIDDTRVSIPPEKKYINASWMYDQTRIARQYILTQTPLESTIEDFWRMIFEHKVICIVILCDKTENEQEVMTEFWPTNNGDFKDYGGMAISNKKSETIQKEQVTILEVLPEGCSNSHLTCIVQLKTWDGIFTQSTGRNLLKIIRVISRVESTSSAAGPVAMMDEYSGISRASILAVVDVMSALLYKGEKNTTLPDLVKWARRCRNGAIKTEDDYVSVIKTIFEYLHRTNQEKYKDQFEKLCGRAEDLN